MKLDTFISKFKSILKEIDPVIELFVYLGIAKLIEVLFSVSFKFSLVIVLVFFLLNIIRLLVERR